MVIRRRLARAVGRTPLYRYYAAARARRARRTALTALTASMQASEIRDELSRNVEQWAPFLRFAPPGHFYSPIPRLDELAADGERLWALPESIPGVDHRPGSQRELVSEIADVLAGNDLPDQPLPAHRYFADNVAFGIGDGLVLAGMLLMYRPRRIVEIGSGYSSALMLDTLEHDLPDTTVTFVEPYTELLRSLMRPGDEHRSRILETRAQDLDVDVVRNLGAGDLLFIDSTHVVRPGSDVCRIVLDLLPEVAPGVIVHIHDMFWPFELPRGWVEEGRLWGECYLVRAFLTDNPHWEILLFNDYVGRYETDLLRRVLPRFLGNPGGSLWLRRVS